MITPSRRVISHKAPQFYPFGNTRYQNVLQDFNVTEKTSNLVEILFLGCGDLRNTLEAITTSGISKFNFHLLDHNPLVLARNIIVLKIISAKEFNLENPADVNFLWDFWYNLEWPEDTKKRFLNALENVLNEPLPNNVVLANNQDLETLKSIWMAWKSTASRSPIELEQLMKKLQMDRPRFTLAAMEEDYPDKKGSSLQERYSKILDAYSADWEENVGAKTLPDHFRRMIRQEGRQSVKTGSCRTENENMVCVNPTMLHPTTYRMIVESSFPFDGYIPLRQGEELDTSDGNQMLIRFCQTKLKTLISSYRQRIKDVKIFLHLGDAFEYCYNNQSTGKFDVVDCSNIADHTGLANLIIASILKLSDSPDAIMLTQSMFWSTKTSSIKQYVEKELCCTLSMIPTLYGLRLLNHAELGTFDPDALRHRSSRTTTLCWEKVPKFQNICLSQSPALRRCLEKLVNRSFSVDGPSKDRDGIEEFKWLHVTPQTFHFMVDSFLQRVEVDSLCMDQLKFPPYFNLSRRTMEAWKKAETILKFTIDQFSTALEAKYLDYFKCIYFNTEKTGSRILRLVLAPNSNHVKSCLRKTVGRTLNYAIDFQGMISSPDVHYIDNFQLEIKNNSDGDIEGASISFLLLRDHGLFEKPYLGFIVELDTGTPILLFESIKAAQVGEYLSPHPFQFPAEPNSEFVITPDGKTRMRIESCTESEVQYTLKISTENRNIDGVNVSTNQEKPCESCHEITVSLCQPTGVEPLVLSFPHPVLAEEIHFTIKDRIVDLVLKKALYEPWSYDFLLNSLKWNVDRLRPWKDGGGFDPLENHVYNQQIPPSRVSELKGLPHVRRIINEIFQESKKIGSELHVVIQSRKTLKPERNYSWLIRVHHPIVTSPLGSPLLLLSVLDSRQWQNRPTKEVVDRVFVRGASSENSLSFTGTAEELELFRFVLRLNSTKMEPSTWQKNNFPLDTNNQLLATFITPLYLDIPTSPDDFDEMSEKFGFSGGTFTPSGVLIDEKSKCVVCKKVSSTLKRCSSCRFVIYCSVECQRAHWPMHKVPCKVLKEGRSRR